MTGCACGCLTAFGRRGLLAGVLAATSFRAMAVDPVGPAESVGPADPGLIEDLVAANRILYDQGAVDGFGHVSVRHDKDPNRYLLSRALAPALVTATDLIEYDLDSNPANANGRTSYLERFIHGEIYKLRPDVTSIVHSHSPGVLLFANTGIPLRPMNHIAGFLGSGPPVFEIRGTAGSDSDMLIRNAALGRALAQALGANHVVLMRGHGSVAAGQSIRHAVYRAVYTEVNARTAAEALKLGKPTYLNAKEAAAASKTNDELVDRPWSLWKQRVTAK